MKRNLVVYPVRLKEETIANLRTAAALTGVSANALARQCIETVFDRLIDDAALGLELQARIKAMAGAQEAATA